jgi:PadR family transcriptional regulator, regulatory protein PadR
MSTARKDTDFLNGVPELFLLRLLAGRPMYGYELVQAIRLTTGGAIAFGEGCIYPVLHRLEAEAMIAGKRETVTGRSRVVYRITRAGRGRLAEAVSRWEAVASAIARVLEGDGDAEPALG